MALRISAGIAAPWLAGLIVQTRGSARLAFVVTGVVALDLAALTFAIAGAAGGAVNWEAALALGLQRHAPRCSEIVLANGGARFELADGVEHFGEGGFADFAFEFFLQAVERGDDAQGAALALRFEREQVGARVLRDRFCAAGAPLLQATRCSG